MSQARRQLLARARSLAELAAERSEAELLRAALQLELRARTHRCAGLLERIAIHYLLLAEHADVLEQPGLASRYFARAWRFADFAECDSDARFAPSSRADA